MPSALLAARRLRRASGVECARTTCQHTLHFAWSLCMHVANSTGSVDDVSWPCIFSSARKCGAELHAHVGAALRQGPAFPMPVLLLAPVPGQIRPKSGGRPRAISADSGRNLAPNLALVSGQSWSKSGPILGQRPVQVWPIGRSLPKLDRFRANFG